MAMQDISSGFAADGAVPERRWWLIGVVLIALLALGRLWWLPAHAPLNVNEGWNAGQALRLFDAGTLYPPPDALAANNYPPLSFLIVGALGRLMGDMILAGRLIALSAEIATGAAVCMLVARLADRRWATAAAILFAAFTVTVLRKYLAINDPQWLGQAAMAWALVLLIPAKGHTLATARVVAAASLIVAGVLVKHNIVAIPLAATLWLALVDRRALAVWIATGALLGGLAGAILLANWGTNVFIDILSPARSYSLPRMLAHGAPLLLAVLPGILAGRPILAASRQDRRMLLPVLLLAVAVPTAFIQRSGEGVGINATFEAFFALTIIVSVGCALRRENVWRWFGIATLPALALLPIAGIDSFREITGRDDAVRHWRPFITQLATAPGPVACDDQALCYWASRQSAFDFFAIKQRLLQGEEAAFRLALEHGDFAIIAMRSENRDWHENRLIPAIRAHYRTIYADDGYEMLVPR